MIIFIIGYMCAGKTSYGKKAARKLKWKFIDMDKEISKQENLSINEIFEIKGEEYFRNKETEFIKNLENLKDENIIVSTGGGAPIRNIDFMNNIGKTIYIKVDPEEILKRLKLNGNLEKRPLLKDLNETELLNKIKSDIEYRESNFYSKAKMTYNGDGKIKDMYSEWT